MVRGQAGAWVTVVTLMRLVGQTQDRVVAFTGAASMVAVAEEAVVAWGVAAVGCIDVEPMRHAGAWKLPMHPHPMSRK